ncbi:phosphoesterase [Aromatoleum petrolei]|uniref:Phosphoesterase n=1 Tax=Aromatoleum petrolei TaxID=76116 RepID=A0ABX1MKI3_9RHOO|nr:phosphoesterase [Aromatoleum petrolei]NMF87655.1 phosphoesterase [Aromatoleum petrolei]QTQ38756.1 DHH phosphoesterase superfamily protein [Aromatoleum petrolei]
MSTPAATIYYHADCLDGFGAAYAAWRLLGDAARYLPMHYGNDWQAEDVTGRDVFILDFSFSRAELERIATLARSVCQIDHHASARTAWAELLNTDVGTGGERFHDASRNLTVIFDLERSGARLAWEYFHPGTAIPTALAHIEDQDMWCFRLPGTRPFCRALRMRDFAFLTWDPIVRASEDASSPAHRALIDEGEAVDRFLAIEVDRLASSALVMPVSLQANLAPAAPAAESDMRVNGLAINASAAFASELGGRLAERSRTFGLVWQLGRDGFVKASLRGCNVVNVARIAEHYGGGGHPNAAGFRMRFHDFLEQVLATQPDPAL